MPRAPFLLSALLPVALVLAMALPVRAEGDAKTDKAPEHKITQSESYTALEPIYTTIVADNRALGMLMVSFGLDVPDAALRAQVRHALPVLRDAWLRNLMAYAASSVHTDEQPDVAAIADRLQAVIDRALKGRAAPDAGGAKVLLAQVAIRVRQ